MAQTTLVCRHKTDQKREDRVSRPPEPLTRSSHGQVASLMEVGSSQRRLPVLLVKPCFVAQVSNTRDQCHVENSQDLVSRMLPTVSGSSATPSGGFAPAHPTIATVNGVHGGTPVRVSTFVHRGFT